MAIKFFTELALRMKGALDDALAGLRECSASHDLRSGPVERNP